MKLARRLLTLAIIGLAAIWLVAGILRLSTAYLEKSYPPPTSLTTTRQASFLLYCKGKGQTVILESGLGLGWNHWYRVHPQTAEFARVCVYDRSGYGWSTASSNNRTAAQLSGELSELLEASGESPPYLLVGHSFGALIAHQFAARHHNQLAGLILLESSEGSTPPIFKDKRISPLLPFPLGTFRLRLLWNGTAGLSDDERSAPIPFQHRAVYNAPPAQMAAEEAEIKAMAESESQLRDAVVPPTIPVTVIIGTGPDAAPTAITRQRTLASRFPSAKIVEAKKSGHMVQLDEPEVIVESIRQMLR